MKSYSGEKRVLAVFLGGVMALMFAGPFSECVKAAEKKTVKKAAPARIVPEAPAAPATQESSRRALQFDLVEEGVVLRTKVLRTQSGNLYACLLKDRGTITGSTCSPLFPNRIVETSDPADEESAKLFSFINKLEELLEKAKVEGGSADLPPGVIYRMMSEDGGCPRVPCGECTPGCDPPLRCQCSCPACPDIPPIPSPGLW